MDKIVCARAGLSFRRAQVCINMQIFKFRDEWKWEKQKPGFNHVGGWGWGKKKGIMFCLIFFLRDRNFHHSIAIGLVAFDDLIPTSSKELQLS